MQVFRSSETPRKGERNLFLLFVVKRRVFCPRCSYYSCPYFSLSFLDSQASEKKLGLPPLHGLLNARSLIRRRLGQRKRERCREHSSVTSSPLEERRIKVSFSTKYLPHGHRISHLPYNCKRVGRKEPSLDFSALLGSSFFVPH